MHRKRRPEKAKQGHCDKASREQHDRSGKTLENRLHFIRGNKQQLVLSQPHRYLYRFLTDTRRASQPDQLSKNTKSDTKCSSHGSVLRGTDDWWKQFAREARSLICCSYVPGWANDSRRPKAEKKRRYSERWWMELAPHLGQFRLLLVLLPLFLGFVLELGCQFLLLPCFCILCGSIICTVLCFFAALTNKNGRHDSNHIQNSSNEVHRSFGKILKYYY
jgi:hypothetical protein